MASNLSRKELLKQDQFSVQVEHSVDFLGAHRKQTILYGGTAIALALIIWGAIYYRGSQQSVRETALGEAITLTVAAVNPPVPLPNGAPSFATDGAKKDAVTKAFTDIVSKYSGSNEAYISEYYLASMDADGAKLDDARKRYQDVADHANAGYASLARLALAQIDVAESRITEGEAAFKDLIAHPTDLVSKDQATVAYARAIAAAKPDDARKLLKPLVDAKSDVSPIANQVMADIPGK